VAILSAESSSLLWHRLADLGSQTSGNAGDQQDTLRLSCRDANWREHAETKDSNTDALPTLFMI